MEELPTILALPAPNSTTSFPLSRPLFIPNPNPKIPFSENPTTIVNLHNYQILQALPALPVTISNYPQFPTKTPTTPLLAPPKMPRSFRGPSHVPEGPAPGLQERRTRSQAAPDWTTHETLVLISQMAALDESWLRALSAHQRWTIVAEDCAKAGVVRSYGQCKRRWEGLLADYTRIKGARKRGKLVHEGEVDDEVFAAMEAVMGTVIKPRKEALQRILESDHEDEMVDDSESKKDDAEMVDDDGDDLTSEEKEENDSDRTRDMVTQLQENADKIQGILRGELEHNPSDSLAGSTSSNAAQLEFTRQQADELIKALGNLSNSLHQFAHLTKAGECEGIRSIDSMAT